MADSHNSGGKRSSGKAPARAKSASHKSSSSSAKILEGFFPQQNTETMEKIMSQGKSQIDKITQEATALGRENFEAWIQSGTIFAKGFEEIARTAIALSQGAAERQAKFLNQALSSKTLNEFAEAQNKIAQANLDDLMSAATKLSEMSVKLMSEAAEPLNEQVGKGIRKASESVAA